MASGERTGMSRTEGNRSNQPLSINTNIIPCREQEQYGGHYQEGNGSRWIKRVYNHPAPNTPDPNTIPSRDQKL